MKKYRIKIVDEVENKYNTENYVFKLSKRPNEDGEYVIRCYKNGKYYEAGSYYTDDWEDALGTLKNYLASQYHLNVTEQSSVYVADSLTENKYERLFNKLYKYLSDKLNGFYYEPNMIWKVSKKDNEINALIYSWQDNNKINWKFTFDFDNQTWEVFNHTDACIGKEGKDFDEDDYYGHEKSYDRTTKLYFIEDYYKDFKKVGRGWNNFIDCIFDYFDLKSLEPLGDNFFETLKE